MTRPTLNSAVGDVATPVIYQGKVRELFDLGDDLLIVVTDRISAHDLRLSPPIPWKGAVLNRLSRFWFDATAAMQKNHFVHADASALVRSGVLPESRLPLYRDRITVAKKAKRIDMECVVRGYLTGSGWRQYEAGGVVNGIELPRGIRKNARLDEAIFTPAIKNDEGHDENISFERMADAVGVEIAEKLKAASLALYEFAHELCEARGVILADCKFEFGFIEDELTLIDECFTPDSARFWAQEAYALDVEIDSMDKEPLRQFLLAEEARTGEMPTTLPESVVEETSRRYLELFRRITGSSLEEE
jgi:phosphoribosylaminoimidazole-succinocarboxamide synthase